MNITFDEFVAGIKRREIIRRNGYGASEEVKIRKVNTLGIEIEPTEAELNAIEKRFKS